MAGALVRGGAGSEIALNDILPSNLRGSSNRARKEAVARDYEMRHPGAVVVCDWELFDDIDIAAMNPTERDQALEDRAHLAKRRAAAAKLGTPDEPRSGGDPGRALELLRRARAEIAGLDVRAADYKKRFEELSTRINELEDTAGQQRTVFKLGSAVKSIAAPLTEAQKAQYREKVERYRQQPFTYRKKAIEQAVDPVLSQFLFDAETEPELRDLWLIKLTEMGALATA